MSDEDLVYWRTLAEERGRAIEVLQQRMRDALAVIPDEQLASFAAALDGGNEKWLRELDRLGPLHEMRAADVASALADLWTRVDADR